jgi:curved DNA-binding protein
MDYYNTLGVSKDATQQEIKQAYRKLAMKHHPDRSGGSSDELSNINNAYDTLGNVEKRTAYDTPQPSPRTFEDMFRQGAYRHQVMRNRNIAARAQITLADVITGKQLFVNYRLYSGKEEIVEINIPGGTTTGTTFQYKGLGDDTYPGLRGDLLVRVDVLPEKNWTRQDSHLMLIYEVDALDMIIGTKITVCTLDNRTIEVKIPPGTQTDARFNIPRFGVPDRITKVRGNLYIHIIPRIPRITDPSTLDQLRKIKDAIS